MEITSPTHNQLLIDNEAHRWLPQLAIQLSWFILSFDSLNSVIQYEANIVMIPAQYCPSHLTIKAAIQNVHIHNVFWLGDIRGFNASFYYWDD